MDKNTKFTEVDLGELLDRSRAEKEASAARATQAGVRQKSTDMDYVVPNVSSGSGLIFGCTRAELIGLVCALLLGVVLGAIGYFTDGRFIIGEGWVSSEQLSSCSRAANRNTPYCQNRLAERKEKWDQAVKYMDARPQFSLNGKGKRR